MRRHECCTRGVASGEARGGQRARIVKIVNWPSRGACEKENGGKIGDGKLPAAEQRGAVQEEFLEPAVAYKAGFNFAQGSVHVRRAVSYLDRLLVDIGEGIFGADGRFVVGSG